MGDYYVMTNWGPMKAHRCHGNNSTITDGAPEDLDTFLEVSEKIKEIDSKINDQIENSVITKEVEELPQASVETLRNFYIDKNGMGYVTVNRGTADNPKYSWIPLGNSLDSENIEDESDYEDVF